VKTGTLVNSGEVKKTIDGRWDEFCDSMIAVKQVGKSNVKVASARLSKSSSKP
jgi:hypothetical protein